MEKRTMNRVMALLLVMLLVFTQMPATAMPIYAQDSGCAHQHDESCAAPCDHEHDESCGGLWGGDLYGEVAAFAPLNGSLAEQYWAPGTTTDKFNLPDSLLATALYDSAAGAGGTDQVQIPVSGWQSDPAYDPDTKGVYIFSPELDLPEGLTLAATPPVITVTIKDLMGISPRIAGTDITDDITDANFLAAVRVKLNKQPSDPISEPEAAAVTGLDISGLGISSLAGIEYFTGLRTLNCSDNQLFSLDLSQNTALTSLSCDNNQLDTLDLSLNTALTSLYCYNNQLDTLDVSLNTALTSLFCYNNQLDTLDVSLNTALTSLSCDNNQLDTLDLLQNPLLTSLNCSNNLLAALDVQNCTFLKTLSCYGNGLTTLDLSGRTSLEHLYCDFNQLSSLDLSDCTALKQLNCYGNQLAALDLSKNTLLEQINCGDNLLTALDVSDNTALTGLYCENNLLTALDVSKNTSLVVLGCGANLLTTLDVSKNTALQSLECYDNRLTSLDVSKCALLKELFAHYNTLSNLGALKARGLEFFTYTDGGFNWSVENVGQKMLTIKSIGKGIGYSLIVGSDVNLISFPDDGYSFLRWQDVSGLSGVDTSYDGHQTVASTRNTMSITAVFEGDSSSGGGSSNSSRGTTVPYNGSNTTITGNVNGENITIAQNSETGAVNMEVAASDAQKAIESAKTTGEIVITIPKTDTITSKTPVEAAISEEAFAAITDSGATLTLDTPALTMSFDTGAVGTIAGAGAGDVIISAGLADASALTEEQKQQIGDRPVYDFSVTVGGQTVSEFGGSVTISLPYTPRAGENVNAIIICYIDADGDVQTIPGGVYDPATGTVKLTTDHFSLYMIGYNVKTFSDAGSHWAKDYIIFAAAREIMSGTDNGQFTPDGSMTRAMFAMALANLDGADLSAYTTSRFNDVPTGQWYAAAVEWAADKGIVSGYDGRFDPNAEITREQMAAMLYNYMKHKGYTMPTGTAPKFADETAISSWAYAAVKAVQKMGIVGGKPGDLYDPQATATRADVATIFARLAKSVAGGTSAGSNSAAVDTMAANSVPAILPDKEGEIIPKDEDGSAPEV